jgi:hypothetical protein
MRPPSAVLFVVVAAIFAGAALVQGQSLAAVARQEQERRKAIKDSGKVYTNKDLKEPPAPPAGPGGQVSDTTKVDRQSASRGKEGEQSAPDSKEVNGKSPSQAGKEASNEGSRAKEPVKDQAYWSGRMKALQAALERDQIYADALQSRINALTTEFVNRDDPAQRAVLATDRDKALAELARVKKAILDDKTAIADLEEEARRAGVPPGWLR